MQNEETNCLEQIIFIFLFASRLYMAFIPPYLMPVAELYFESFLSGGRALGVLLTFLQIIQIQVF